MQFLTRAQTQNFLASDPDGFIARLGPLDLKARKCQTQAEYKARAVSSADSFTPYEKDAIWRQAQIAQEFLETTRYAGLRWRFAKASYEEGLPHTRTDIIFIPGIVSARILVHEIVHVNQKLRGPNTPQGYSLSHQNFENLRANPDTDGRVWYKNGLPAGSYYGPNPRGITDVTERVLHPYEAEAYALDELFSRA